MHIWTNVSYLAKALNLEKQILLSPPFINLMYLANIYSPNNSIEPFMENVTDCKFYTLAFENI